MRASELRINDVCFTIALQDRRGVLTVPTVGREDSEMSCSLDNLLAVCKGPIRYHIAGKDIEGTLEKVGGHIILAINRNGDCTEYVIPLETFELAIQALTPRGAANRKGRIYLS